MDKKCVVVKREIIEKTLENPPEAGKRLLEPLKTFAAENSLPFNVLEDKDISNEAEVHACEGDLWQCLEGEVEFIYGGDLVEPWFKKNADGTEDKREAKAKEIKNGTKATLYPGDWLWIPAGQPHQHNKLGGHARLAIIKIPKA